VLITVDLVFLFGYRPGMRLVESLIRIARYDGERLHDMTLVGGLTRDTPAARSAAP
jgi:hypothetical protein